MPSPYLDALRSGLHERGWVEGRNIKINAYWATGQQDMDAVAHTLAASNPEVIITQELTIYPVRSLNTAASVVFGISGDPVDAKFVDSLARPGGNLTGIGKDTLQRSLDCLRLVGMCAAYGQASGAPDPIDLIKDLGMRGSLMITRPALSHYLSTRSEIDAAAKSLFDAVAQGVISSNVVETFPLREAAAAHKFIGGRKTTGSIVMLPFA